MAFFYTSIMRNYIFIFGLLASLIPGFLIAQTGISVSPPRTFYQINPGESEVKKLLITNPSPVHGLDLSVSIHDWHYDESGSNVVKEAGSIETSCAEWISILPASIFHLGPNESTELDILLNPPEDLDPKTPVHTVMLYITQLNPTNAIDQQGANIQVAVRTGVKIYHRDRSPRKHHIEPLEFYLDKDNQEIILVFENQSNVWTDGSITSELLSQTDGRHIQLPEIAFYTLPDDKRKIRIPLDKNLPSGTYIISSVFEYADIVNMAELKFEYEANEK